MRLRRETPEASVRRQRIQLRPLREARAVGLRLQLANARAAYHHRHRAVNLRIRQSRAPDRSWCPMGSRPARLAGERANATAKTVRVYLQRSATRHGWREPVGNRATRREGQALPKRPTRNRRRRQLTPFAIRATRVRAEESRRRTRRAWRRLKDSDGRPV